MSTGLVERIARVHNGLMTRGLTVMTIVVMLTVSGCVAEGLTNEASSDRWLVALPAGASPDADAGGPGYTVRVTEGLAHTSAQQFDANGSIALVDLDPRSETTVPVSSTGSLPLDLDEVPMLELVDGYARPIVDPTGRTLGFVSASAGRYGMALDVDADGDADVIEGIATGDVVRVVVTTAAGREFLDGALGGECAGSGGAGWDAAIAVVVRCGVEPGAVGGPSGAGPRMAASGAPFAAPGVLRDPAAEPELSDGDQLIADLERYGADVVLGALLNDAVGDLLPDSASETLGAIGGIVADGEGDAADIARILSRSTDDLRDAVAEILASLGETDPTDGDQETGSASSGCELTTSDGACVDGDDAGSRGDPHHTTHDGLDYDFQVVGEYLLTRTPTELVHVRYEPYLDSRSVSVLTAISVRTPDGVVQARLGDRPFELESSWNGERLSTPETLAEGGTRIEIDEGTLAVAVDSGFRLVVRAAGSLLNSYLAVEEPTSGLLGDNDGDPANDLRVGDRIIGADSDEITTALADAWRLVEADSLLPYREGESRGGFDDPSFPEERVALETLDERATTLALVICREAGVLLPGELASCVFDVAVTGDHDLADGYAAAAPPLDDIGDDELFRLSRGGRDWAYPVVAWASEVISAGDALDGDPADVLGPQNTRNASIGEGDASCEQPLDLGFDAEIVDGRGPELGVAHIGIGSLEYEVWVADGDGPWVFAGALSGRSVLDLETVIGAGGSADRVRLCDAPAETDGTGQPATGPAFDAVAILGVKG